MRDAEDCISCMHPMGVITCTVPMNPSGDVIYTHKKFKRATSEACDNAEQQQQNERGKKGGTEVASAGARTPSTTSQASAAGARPTTTAPQFTPTLVNGHVTAQTVASVTGSVVNQLSVENDDNKRKVSNSSGGKYKCEYCGVGCAKPSVLDKHKRTHTNERPYTCEQCSLAFKTKSNYKKHTRSRTHVRKCDGVALDNSDGTIESSDNVDGDVEDGPKSANKEGRAQQLQPADFSVSRTSIRDQLQDLPTASVSTHHDELGTLDRSKSLYKPKFHISAHYAHREERGPKGQTPPPSRQQPTPPQDAPQLDHTAISSSTYQPHTASTHGQPNQVAPSNPSRHSPSPATVSKQGLPPLDIWAANKKDEGVLTGQRNSVQTPQSANSLWKGIKSPSPELVGQHITKLIVENQAIVDTHNPLWSRRYRRQPSIGSSSSESDGSGTSKSRRSSLADLTIKNSKAPAVGSSSTAPSPAGLGPLQQQYSRERSHSVTAEAMMAESRSYSPSLPPTPHLPLAQPPVTPISASKPSISSQGHTTSYSQSAPAFTTSTMGMMDLTMVEGSRKRRSSEGPSVVRDIHKSRVTHVDDPAILRQHPQNPEGSVIKSLLLHSRATIAGTIDQKLERLECERLNQPTEGHYPCSRCGVPCRSPESLEVHLRHYCGQRLGGTGSERGTPDSVKSGDGGRWPSEQDVALDLQKKPDRTDHFERERSLSRGSSVGESSQRRGSEEENRYRPELSPRIYRSESVPEGASPPTKKRKMSDVDVSSQDRSMFLPPIFSPRGQGANKGDTGMKILEDMNKQKTSNLQLFGGEVQICDGNERKTMRIDPSQPPSPAIDICIPPQQLGGNIPKAEVSLPTSVVVTIAKSGLNSGGTMVQVESQISTSSTKTVPSLVSSSISREQPSVPTQTQSNSKAPLSTIVYNDASKFAFSPFLPYAPLLQLPNLAIPGIPTPDLGSLSFPTYPASGPVQSFLPVKNSAAQGMMGKHKVNTIHSPAAPSPSKLSPGAGIAASGQLPSGNIGNPLGNQQIQVIREKEKEQFKGSSKSPATYPALIPIGDEKVPYVPGIPGPYSQAGMVVQPPLHRIQKNPAVFAPPITASSFSPMSQAPVTLPQPPALMSPSREKGLQPPRSKDFPRSPVREHQSFHAAKVPSRQSPQLPPKEIQISRGKASVSVSFKSSERNMTPDVRLPGGSETSAFDKKVAEKSSVALDESRNDTAGRDETKDCEEFLPPRKRPDTLALKPQPYVPNSSLALIGTTLVSPDTPRPKKSCVQMFLNGSAYTYLGHKVSTKSYFCCISRQQPMYVPQSTDPKLSMYSNWQLRKPAEDNPLNLTPYQHMSLYNSRKVDQTYTVAKPRELNLIQTHSSYWTFKEEKEKNKSKEEKHKDKDPKVVKNEDPVTRTSEPSSSEDNRPAIKREPEEECAEPSSKNSDDAETSDSSTVKRIKIFEGGFKSSEDYTYVRGRGRGRYVCGVCEIRCKKPSMLKKHIRTHTDLRPYACSHCTFSFKTKGNLTKHLRSKAHYKRCMEMGIVPVPTVVDESHVNEEALAMQGKMEQEQERVLEGGDDDDDDDEEEEEDEEDDGDEDDEDDEEALENDQFEDADKMDIDENCTKSEAELKREVRESKENMGLVGNPSRSGVLVMAISSCSSSSNPAFAHSSKDVKSQKLTDNAESLRDSPMDLSVRKTAVLNLSPAQDKNLAMKKPPVPRRPSYLPLMAKSSMTDLRSPVANLTSPGTPTTPIREHPSEILSPVTESSTLLKSIYNTTSRATHVSNREKLDIVIDPSKENGCNNSMLQAYIKECAVLDTTIKRQQYKDSSSDTSPDSPHNSLIPNHSGTSVSTAGAENSNEQPQKSESIQNDRGTSLDEIKREGRTENESLGVNSEQSCTSEVSSSSCTTAVNSTPQAATSRMPTPPANLTVMNNGGMDTKTAFLVPSGVVPSSLNRLGNDDGKCRCSICHKEFNRPSQLTLHMNIHYMERPYRCESCAISFRTNGHLQKHKRSVSHFNKVNRNMTFGTPSTDNPRPFKCHDCKIAFRIHGHLAKHLRSKMHIMKLECLGKLPFGTYAEIERSGANLNEIDTTDCDNSLESLQVMASRLYEKDPSKLAAWQNQQQHRVRTVSNSSTNSDDYPLQDDQDDSFAGCGNDDDTEGDEDEEISMPQDAPRLGVPGSSVGPIPTELHSPHSHGIPPIEIGSGATAGLLACHICHEKFLDLEHLSGHLYNVHKVSVTYRNS